MTKKYIIDTSVLIDNPDCIEILRNGEENEIFLPYSCILELNKLKDKKSELTYTISKIGTVLENDDKVKVIKHKEIKYEEATIGDENVIKDIMLFISQTDSSERCNIRVVTNDKYFRIRLKVEGIGSESFKSSHPVLSPSQLYTGFIELDSDIIVNSFSWFEGKPVYHLADGTNKTIDYINKIWNVTPRNIYQNLAFELMMNPDIDVVTLQSEAGYGKTFQALACALELILNKEKQYEKIYILRPNIEIGEKLGYLPGNIEEKMVPYFKPIENLLLKLHNMRAANRIFKQTNNGEFELDPKKCEILPLNFVRGMTLEECVVIIDEAQNLTRSHMRTILTRMGMNVKVFILGDVEQIDNPFLNSFNNGLTWCVEKFKGMPGYGHMVLKGQKSRGPITDMVLKSGL